LERLGEAERTVPGRMPFNVFERTPGEADLRE
jgi:hypothetical protein